MRSLAVLLSVGTGVVTLAAGEKIIFSSSGGDTGPANAAKTDPRLALPWSSGNSVPGQRIVFSMQRDQMVAPESARKESLLAPTLDLLKSTASISTPDTPFVPGSPAAEDARAPLTKQQQQMLDKRQGWLYDSGDTQRNGANSESLQNSGNRADNKPKSPMERYMDARAQNRRDSGTNSFTRDYANPRLMNPDGSSARQSGADGRGQDSSFDSTLPGGARLDGSADLVGRGPGNDSLGATDGEKLFQRMGNVFRDRAKERQTDFEEFKKLFDPAPNAFAPSSTLSGQSAIEAARQSGAPVSLQGLGDFTHRFDSGENAFSARNIGGSGTGASLFDAGRPTGLPGLQPVQIAPPDLPRPKPAPSSFDLPKRSF